MTRSEVSDGGDKSPDTEDSYEYEYVEQSVADSRQNTVLQRGTNLST
jgi:hypothetical protein